MAYGAMKRACSVKNIRAWTRNQSERERRRLSGGEGRLPAPAFLILRGCPWTGLHQTQTLQRL